MGPNGGHSNGRKLPIALTGLLLNDAEMMSAVSDASENTFSENAQVFTTNKASVSLWGSHTGNRWGESRYWQKWRENKGARTVGDWYGYIDGGEKPGGVYQGCCTSQAFKATAIAVQLMPGLKAVWNDNEFLDYADRWVYFGAWTQPDPCAPYDGIPSNYGITYGPDGNGSCVKDTDPSDGIGRFPNLHGTNADGGGYGSSFANAVWAEYRGDIDVDNIAYPPGQPKRVRTISDSASSITITWDDIKTESSYRVERRTGNEDWSVVHTPSRNTTSVNDDDLLPNTKYEYRVIATNRIDDSLPSASVSATTLQALDRTSSNDDTRPVAHYTFDENVRDQSGNGYDGSLQGNPEYVSGIKGQALEFDGTNDYVNLSGSSEAFNFTESFSFSMWMRPAGSVGGYVFGKGAQSGGLVGQYAFASNAVRIADSTGKKVQVGTGLVADEWQHVVGTWDGTTLRVYRNGELHNEASNAAMGALGYRHTNNVHIGTERSKRYYYRGLLDEMYVYDRAISSDEVTQLYGQSQQVSLIQPEQQYANVLQAFQQALESLSSMFQR